MSVESELEVFCDVAPDSARVLNAVDRQMESNRTRHARGVLFKSLAASGLAVIVTAGLMFKPSPALAFEDVMRIAGQGDLKHQVLKLMRNGKESIVLEAYVGKDYMRTRDFGGIWSEYTPTTFAAYKPGAFYAWESRKYQGMGEKEIYNNLFSNILDLNRFFHKNKQGKYTYLGELVRQEEVGDDIRYYATGMRPIDGGKKQVSSIEIIVNKSTGKVHQVSRWNDAKKAAGDVWSIDYPDVNGLEKMEDQPVKRRYDLQAQRKEFLESIEKPKQTAKVGKLYIQYFGTILDERGGIGLVVKGLPNWAYSQSRGYTWNGQKLRPYYYLTVVKGLNTLCAYKMPGVTLNLPATVSVPVYSADKKPKLLGTAKFSVEDTFKTYALDRLVVGHGY